MKNVSQKILAFATIAVVGLLLTACCNQREIAQPTVQVIPTHKIDTCFDVKSDTILFFETDTLRVDAIVRDAKLRLRVETKPLIVRDTINTKGETEKAKIKKEKAKIEKEKAKKNEEKAKENSKKTKLFLAFLMFFILPPLLFFIKKK